eukprot:731159-Alexandrium_andersonii.AAC.1
MVGPPTRAPLSVPARGLPVAVEYSDLRAGDGLRRSKPDLRGPRNGSGGATRTTQLGQQPL